MREPEGPLAWLVLCLPGWLGVGLLARARWWPALGGVAALAVGWPLLSCGLALLPGLRRVIIDKRSGQEE